jgi:hypothetical protein
MLNTLLVVAALLLTQAPVTQAPVTVPDTPAGRGLKEFITSFNAGGAERRTWVTTRTTVDADAAANILEQDAALLEEHGGMTIVRLPSATATEIMAIVRHTKSGAHAHLTLEASPDAPYKVTDLRLRPATPDEISGK